MPKSAWLLLVVNMVFLTEGVFSQEPTFLKASLKELVLGIQKNLQEEITLRTGRQNVTVTIEGKQSAQNLHFTLNPRDERDTLFHLTITTEPNRYRVAGRVLTQETLQKTQRLLGQYLPQNLMQSEISVSHLGIGTVAVPCADLYVEPKREKGDNLASQLLYGMQVTLLEQTADGQFFCVMGEDNYIGWLAANILTRDSNALESVASKVYLTARLDSPQLYPGTPLYLVAGGNVQTWPHTQPFTLAARSYHMPGKTPTPAEIVTTAKRFLPAGDLGPNTYLWGGTCIPELDCSGFVQLTFRLHGLILPRDADQQYQYGKSVAVAELRSGDLIFFSKHKRHPTHVGIYLGNGEYIHCSPTTPSGVKINKLEGEASYDKYLRSIYYGAVRILDGL